MPENRKLMTPQHLRTLLILHIRHALKSGLACVLAYAVSGLLGLNFPLWAVVSTIIAMQGLSVADSVQHSLMRFSGMAIGAVVGMGLLLIAPENEVLLALELFTITAVGAYLIRYGMRYMLATTAACIMLLGGRMVAAMPGGIQDPLVYGLTLVAEVTIGVAAALAVSFLLWPVKLGDTLRADLSSQFKNCADLLKRVADAYLDGQRHVSPKLLEALGLQTWGNHESMNKVRRLESHIYRGYRRLRVLVFTVDRTVEALNGLIDVLNEYEEAPYVPMLGPELNTLAGHVIRALNHLGDPDGDKAAPEIVRDLTLAVDAAERRLTFLRSQGTGLSDLPLHRVLQLYTFYQTLRQLTEEILLSMHDLQVLEEIRGKNPRNRLH